MGRLEARASRVVESRSPAQVWAFIRPAESAVLLDPDTVRGFTVPGTESGVGEQQCFFTLVDGREVPHVLTITAVEPEVFAKAVSSSGGIPSGSGYELEPVDNGTPIVLRSWLCARRSRRRRGRHPQGYEHPGRSVRSPGEGSVGGTTS